MTDLALIDTRPCDGEFLARLPGVVSVASRSHEFRLRAGGSAGLLL